MLIKLAESVKCFIMKYRNVGGCPKGNILGEMSLKAVVTIPKHGSSQWR